MALEAIQDKWYKKAIAGFKENWARMVKMSESLDAFVRGISAVTGIPEATVRASLPAKNWAEFQREADKYLPIALSKIEAAYRAGKWKVKYRKAFGG
jgi:hypothetical protein